MEDGAHPGRHEQALADFEVAAITGQGPANTAGTWENVIVQPDPADCVMVWN